MLANRLKEFLPFIISPNQNAFIPRRLISDNVFATYETLHSMQTHQWGKTGHVAVKLDMSKDDDWVEWGFLDEVMKRMGFAQHWRGLIMHCIQFVQFSYLFFICAKALSNMLYQYDLSGWLTWVPTSPKGPQLNHLFFADDSLLFCRAIVRYWGSLTHLLEVYEKALGQQLNKEKTSIFFSSVATLVPRLEIVLFGYLGFLAQRDMINIWVSLPSWENLECRSLKVLKIRCESV